MSDAVAVNETGVVVATHGVRVGPDTQPCCCGEDTVDCNACNPPLTAVYHVVLTLADTTVVEADVTNTGQCTWVGNTGPPQNADIYLDWDGFDWTVTTAGLNPLYGSSDQCSPTGNYANVDGDTAVVS